jgi:hypothetical protein
MSEFGAQRRHISANTATAAAGTNSPRSCRDRCRYPATFEEAHSLACVQCLMLLKWPTVLPF